ncbi:MAG: ureidoglycolate lyase [Sphaerochaetaceae bacterium]
MRVIKVERLESENFKKFGKLIAVEEGKKLVDNEIVTHWHELADLNSLGENPVVAFVNCKRRSFVLSELERHLETSEIFFPIEGQAIMVFAGSLADGSVDLDSLSAFVISEGKPFISNVGVWHWVPYPVGESWKSFLLVSKGLVESDIEKEDLPEKFRIEL